MNSNTLKESNNKTINSRELLHALGAEKGVDSMQTETLQLKMTDCVTGENKVVSPVIYQSCMNPDDIRIYPLKVMCVENAENTVIAENRYERIQIDLRRQQIQISEWKAEIHKTECTKCENCGRCGW